ncbi:molecular chaperone DnaJ [Legionella geestiana]|uniref:Molecular chaperone DnaJ n=1 Tax=Legionella geestiana TaxID=45065 RepID=A0A0W0TT77_9GAMM|nr:DnaJ domain-containing protein [Legionella geestiana]KTC98825.1 molecular chaperone DnaJ [Legionella geestiana]QBS12826.1 J domain-containing protein [Legionella geestiana]STX54690.1 molecular chaperone DnaJ [Legionella geestiana]
MHFSIENNYYSILAIDREATAADVKSAYRRIAKLTHPDRNPGSDGALFKLAKEAYDTLIDPDKRLEYNTFIDASQLPRAFSQNEAGTSKSQQKNAHTNSRSVNPKQRKINVANQRMRNLRLNREMQKHVWQIYTEFYNCNAHFLQHSYADEILKILLYVFEDINLSHLAPECRNNPEIVDAGFKGSLSFKNLCYAGKDAIMTLLNNKNSALSSMLYNSREYPSMNMGFLQYYPYGVDIELFIRLIDINPAVLRPLLPQKILAFLRTEEVRQQAPNVLDFYKSYHAHDAGDDELELLFEIYKNYSRNILRNFDSFDCYSNNRRQLRMLVRRLFIAYPNDIHLADIISIDKLIDEDTLAFHFSPEEETLTCTGRLLGTGQPFEFSHTYNILEPNTSWDSTTFINELASSLHPEVFCRMLASIPRERREYFMFSHQGKFASNSAYHAYKDHLERVIDWSKATKKAHLDALEQIIYPVNTDVHILSTARQQICDALREYTSWWKLSLFGHHHDARARHVIQTIQRADTLAQIGLIIENQLALMENQVNEPMFMAKNRLFALDRIFANQQKDWHSQNRWYNSAPINLPRQENPMHSGYYRALKEAQRIIGEHHIHTLPASSTLDRRS